MTKAAVIYVQEMVEEISESLGTSTLIGKQFVRAMLGKDVPFGYRFAEDGLSLEEDPFEQATLADVRELRRSGWSWQRIAKELNDREVTPPGKARAWNWLSASKVAA